MTKEATMKKEHRWILLESSGELSKLNRWRLKRALSKDSDLLAYAKTHSDISRLYNDHPLAPPTFNTAELDYLARRQKSKPQQDFFSLWQPALSYGAIAIALSMTVVYLSQHWESPSSLVQAATSDEETLLTWDDPYFEDLNELALSFSQFDSDFDPLSDYSNSSSDTDDLDQLAQELLNLGESS